MSRMGVTRREEEVDILRLSKAPMFRLSEARSLEVFLLPLSVILVVCVFLFFNKGWGLHGS